MAEKTRDKILKGIAAWRAGRTRTPLHVARAIARQVVDVLVPPAKAVGLHVAPFYGGTPIERQDGQHDESGPPDEGVSSWHRPCGRRTRYRALRERPPAS